MCKYSIEHATIDAKHGQVLSIGKTDTSHGHTYPTFHPAGDTTGICACVKGNTKLTLTGVPPVLQRKFGIGPTAIVTMIEKVHNAADYLKLENGKEFPLIDFANNHIVAYIGEPETKRDTTAAVEELKAGATAAAEHSAERSLVTA